ncbi:MAG TPA: fumarylacetoacetate hydrolase family protein [Rubrobacter sp.]|nr:fumarylacetoacetate hydrolase family protein [Rubrobacter sp.]
MYRRPRKIWGIGLNYADHAGDLDEAAPAEEPASFMRPDTTIIGREAKNISEDKAPSVVAGFTTGLDTTAEDILRRNPRYLTRDKSFDTFFSFGPHLLTQDEVGRWARWRSRRSSTARRAARTPSPT